MTHPSQLFIAEPPVAASPLAEKRAGPVACPCCAGSLEHLYTIERFEQPIHIEACPGCGFQMQTSPPAPSKLYTEEYYTGEAQYSYRDERKAHQFDSHVHKARLRTIARHVPPPADFLDVGCAFGSFVRSARDFGYNARGIDISPYAAREARAAGLAVTQGTLDSQSVASASADVITLIEVIEHLPDPGAVFAQLARITRPGGLVVIQTANFLGYQARLQGSDYHYYLPGHVCYYSTRTLRLLLARHGFSRVRFYRPVDFGLLAKLRKSRGSFRRYRDYVRWLRITWYHLLGRVAWGDFALTSSMTAYAIRDEQ